MPLSSKLDRKLRAAEESSDDEEYYEVTDRSSSPSLIETGEGGELLGSDEEEEQDQDGSEEEEDAQAQMSKVSFGALAKAQDAISKQQSADRKRKRGEDTSKSQEDKLQILRKRLQEIKAAKLAQGAAPQPKSKSRKTQPNRDDDDERDDDDDSDSDEDAAPNTRSSKHAPAVQSSKRAVTRKRTVVDAKKPKFRDPRFDTGALPDETTLDKRYAFLNDYKNSEMNDLREAIKKTKSEADKEKLKKKLTSMESQQKAQRRKEEQQAILSEHKKKEKELIKQGKKPFFLKKCKCFRITPPCNLMS